MKWGVKIRSSGAHNLGYHNKSLFCIEMKYYCCLYLLSYKIFISNEISNKILSVMKSTFIWTYRVEI